MPGKRLHAPDASGVIPVEIDVMAGVIFGIDDSVVYEQGGHMSSLGFHPAADKTVRHFRENNGIGFY
jgi:hypothetical protein